MKKNKKNKYIDDGHTVYNMDMVSSNTSQSKKNDIQLTRKEKNTAIRAALAHYLPILFGVIICFLLAMLIIYFWLR